MPPKKRKIPPSFVTLNFKYARILNSAFEKKKKEANLKYNLSKNIGDSTKLTFPDIQSSNQGKNK
jgi:hypothetical protein